VEWLQLINLGGNFGALAAVLALLATGKLVARSWAMDLVEQARDAAERAQRSAEAADARADLVQTAMVEQTAAIRAMETALLSVGMGWPHGQAQSSTWRPRQLPAPADDRASS
jgi:hypothetical protein